jgi:hypothetical protein
MSNVELGRSIINKRLKRRFGKHRASSAHRRRRRSGQVPPRVQTSYTVDRFNILLGTSLSNKIYLLDGERFTINVYVAMSPYAANGTLTIRIFWILGRNTDILPIKLMHHYYVLKTIET